MSNPLTSLGYLCVGTLFGLAVMAVVLAVARRRRTVDESLSRAYGPLHALLSENAGARAKIAEMEERLMSNYAAESAPYSAEEKKAAAEGFLAAEMKIRERVLNPNRESMRRLVAEAGHLLRDDDYLSVTAELAEATAARALADLNLPKAMRDKRPVADREGDVLEQIRVTYLDLSRERRAGFFRALLQGIKHLFAAD
jgi:hypothetical protein